MKFYQFTQDVFDFESLPNCETPPLYQYQTREGTLLSYRFYDSQNKECIIILLHGSSAHGEYLHPLADYLSSQGIGQVYVPNLRGHYMSEGARRGDCTYIGQLEDDLSDLIHFFKLHDKQIYLVGHSSGGGLAIRFAGCAYKNLIKGYVLLSPAIPTAPSMRQGTAGGWAKVSIWKIIVLSILNSIGIVKFNHSHVIWFNKSPKHCDGKETLSYSFNLNSSYHPRLPYQKDISALKDKFILFVGADDEANDPLEYPKVMKASGKVIQVIKGVRHLNIVLNQQIMHAIAAWIEKKEKKI